MRARGFTLIELLITILVMAILVTIASFSYMSQSQRGRRIDAINTLLSISLAQERYRSQNTQYGNLAQVWGGVTTTEEGYYTIAITSNSASGYTVTATAQGAQANDSQDGTSCATLTLTMNNGTVTKTPADCWPS